MVATVSTVAYLGLEARAVEVQCQIAAGLLVLTGVLLGTFVAAPWYGLAGFVGAGLTFAGATGFCGMARLLMLMPWNRAQAA